MECCTHSWFSINSTTMIKHYSIYTIQFWIMNPSDIKIWFKVRPTVSNIVLQEDELLSVHFRSVALMSVCSKLPHKTKIFSR